MAVIYDQFGRKIQGQVEKRPDRSRVYLSDVRDRWSNYPSDGLTPVKLAQILKEADNGDVLRQAELFEEMEEKDCHLGSQIQTRKLALQGLEWEITPADESAAAKRVTDFCVEAVQSLSDFDDYLLDLMDAMPKGFSMMEVLWDASSGGASIEGLRWIHPKRVTFWDSMTPRVLTDDGPVTGVDLPAWKCLYHRYKARSGYDTRAGILRVCSWMYMFKNYAIKDWVAYAEVYGAPLRVGKYEAGTSDADKTALLNAVASIGSDAAGIISKATEIEFVQAQKTGTLNIYESLAMFCDAQMSKAVLGQTLTSDSGTRGSGSYALGRVHDQVRQDILESDSKALAQTLTHQFIRPLVGFNFGWDAPIPQFRFLSEPPEDLKSIAETYKILMDLGYEVSQEHLEERFKVPRIQEGETPLKKPAVPSPFGNEAGIKPGRSEEDATQTDRDDKKTAKAGVQSDRFGWDAIQPDRKDDTADLIEEMIQSEASDELDALVDPLAALIEGAGSLEEVRDRLLDAYPNMDATRLGEVLQRALILADLAGRFDGDVNR